MLTSLPGVPKFFRWMSERYPAISQLIAENRIPEFDCLYLDMNGIIHNCTHSDSDSVTHRMTEDKMFIAIFNYIEHLFGKIKPKQLFFMAIDGVAPRAKMNQQRARRFRSAKDAEDARNKAIAAGTEMPKEAPSTATFMARLTQQLKYFISKKVSEDVDWQGVEIVLSGHEVPGEGEHKVMEYIRKAKAQPSYDPNMRHCLYGLDADLIMLGLLSHDPHFCLLREEVTFGRQSAKKSKELEHQNFYLMHLCIVREYLELEFQELKEPGALGFPFDMERVIDDFILMAFFVGNDFLPNLPHLHINEGALSLMFNVYKTVLPKAKGYINEGGTINLERLGVLLDELSHVEYRFFEAENADASWFKGKQMEKEDVMERTGHKKRGQVVMSTPQKEIYNQVKTYVNNRSADDQQQQPLDLPVSLPARDRKFVEELADSLHLQWKSAADDNGERHMQLSFFPRAEHDDSEDEEDEEAQSALLRVFKRYDKAQIVDVSPEEAQAKMEAKYEQKFQQWKDQHYKSKFEWGIDNEEELRKLTENYVQGLQWVLYYYYRGVASWPWFFNYHYSPMISDVKKGLAADMNFQLGQPFRPYQQLMGVLPDRSKQIKMEWEAVVKIPFIDEKRLLPAMATKDHLLTDAERGRNEFGVSLKFTYAPEIDFVYPSSLPGIFLTFHTLPTMEGLDVYIGLVEGVKLGEESLAGFPSLRTLPTTGTLGFHGVNVFQQESRNESMVITVMNSEMTSGIENAKLKLGQAVHVGYPFLQEAKVTKVSDEIRGTNPANIEQIPHGPQEISEWKKKADRLEGQYSRRLAIITGQVESLVHVDMLVGLRKTESGATVKQYAAVPGTDPDFLTQMIVDEVISEDQRFLEQEALPLQEEFPEGSHAFFLGEYAYGRPLMVNGHKGEKADVWVSCLVRREPEFGRDIAMQAERMSPYIPAFAVAKQLNLPNLVLSKLTASFRVMSSGLQLNLGLNLKFEAKKQKVLGYSRKSDRGWEYSQKAIDLIAEYMMKFPEFIAGMVRNPQGDVFNDTDFYPADVARDKMKEIGAWLKSMETKRLERVPLDAQQMDSDTVKAIELAADQNEARNNDQQHPNIVGKQLSNVPRHALLRPVDAEHRLGGQRFVLGDRVVYVPPKGRVPIASRGTVVGITRTPRTTLLDVVFDSTFMAGTTLGDRCSPFRGSTIPVDSVLNLTDRQCVVGSRAQAERAPAVPFTPLTMQGGVGTQGGLREAPAPAPLRGGYRGALTGRGRGRGGAQYAPNGAAPGQPQDEPLPIRTAPNGAGSRGRGGQMNGTAASFAPRGGKPDGAPQRGSYGANRGGYTVVDNSDPSEGVVRNNPTFRPQNYSNVPPPASLDARGRGSRGGFRGGRGRGDFVPRGRGRGRGTAAIDGAAQ
ncbi:exonuclease II Exo2 [Taxawa tesnikishii (nom. ined.)]|nr:exonuclease II Exo2 [Dothideales sp. JES 119]